MTGITMIITSFGLLFFADLALLCIWYGRRLLHEAPVNLDARGAPGASS